MFSGIVEATSVCKSVQKITEGLRLQVGKPQDFNDLSIGDSICFDGVCLTVEEFDESFVSFVAAAETLQVTGWESEGLMSRPHNLERSLRFGARIHGHLVTGHVDQVVHVCSKQTIGESLIIHFSMPQKMKNLVWKKGCITINGVSLTVNDVTSDQFSVCIIPETYRKTNLSTLNVGDSVNMEADYLAKSLISSRSDFSMQYGLNEMKVDEGQL